MVMELMVFFFFFCRYGIGMASLSALTIYILCVVVVICLVYFACSFPPKFYLCPYMHTVLGLGANLLTSVVIVILGLLARKEREYHVRTYSSFMFLNVSAFFLNIVWSSLVEEVDVVVQMRERYLSEKIFFHVIPVLGAILTSYDLLLLWNGRFGWKETPYYSWCFRISQLTAWVS